MLNHLSSLYPKRSWRACLQYCNHQTKKFPSIRNETSICIASSVAHLLPLWSHPESCKTNQTRSCYWCPTFQMQDSWTLTCLQTDLFKISKWYYHSCITMATSVITKKWNWKHPPFSSKTFKLITFLHTEHILLKDILTISTEKSLLGCIFLKKTIQYIHLIWSHFPKLHH